MLLDKPKLIEALLYIDNKDKIVVPFKLNSVQRLYAADTSLRKIILKARQMGLSAYRLAELFIEAITVPNTNCVVVSAEGYATKRLLDRVHFYYESMGEPKPKLGSSSRTEISFPDINSVIYLGTAGSITFGRGDRIDHCLLSELSFYEDGERIVNAIEEAVPLNGTLTIECTPNGEGNIFYEMWIKAREKRSSYSPLFLPWWLGTDNVMGKNHPQALPEDRGSLLYTEEEKDLREKFGITENQVRWRRYKIANKGGLFYQEYPEDEVSCFITIGDPVFDQFILTSLAQSSYEGEHHTQGWTFWRKPQEKFRYVMGVDSSAGAPGGSYSAAVILNDLWEVCATFQARLDPHTFAGILRDMGKWYNTAEIAVERNFTGYAVLEQLRDYPHIYHQRDYTTGKVTTQRGWWTNSQTRDLLMTVTKEKFSQLKMWDVNLVRQLRSYRYLKLKSNKVREQAQTFDDLAIALMIACVVKKVEGGARGYIGKIPSWDW